MNINNQQSITANSTSAVKEIKCDERTNRDLNYQSLAYYLGNNLEFEA